MGENGYEYDELTRTLTIHVQLNDGDQVEVRANIDSTKALLIVESNAGDGEIALVDVKPTLKSYHPEVGNYVIKINGYTEILQKLYKLIDSRLTEENSVPDEYKITEIKLNPENFDEAGKYLPEAGIKNLGEVYKIINQDNEGNTVAYKYYVCEMQISTYLDDDGKTQNRYTYTWEERDLVFGEDGVNSLKEKIDIYSSINSVQIAAEWDQKPKDSAEYQSYKDNLEKLQNAKTKLEEKQKTVEGIETKIQLVREQIQLISKDIDINTNFSPDSLDRMSLFLREDEYTDDYVYTPLCSGISIDYQKMKSESADYIGWLNIEDTKISYPVMFCEGDNAFYLHHLPDGTKNFAGSLFLDGNSTGIDSENLIIYGHNMKNGSMFGRLKKFTDEEYFENHPYIELHTERGIRYYLIFSVSR